MFLEMEVHYLMVKQMALMDWRKQGTKALILGIPITLYACIVWP